MKPTLDTLNTILVALMFSVFFIFLYFYCLFLYFCIFTVFFIAGWMPLFVVCGMCFTVVIDAGIFTIPKTNFSLGRGNKMTLTLG